MGAVVAYRGQGTHERLRFIGVLASLAEIAVAAFVSISRLSPSSPLTLAVPIAICVAATLLGVGHIRMSVQAMLQDRKLATTGAVADLIAYILPFSAYAFILDGVLLPGPEWWIGLGVLWLTVSGLFQSVLYLATSSKST